MQVNNYAVPGRYWESWWAELKLINLEVKNSFQLLTKTRRDSFACPDSSRTVPCHIMLVIVPLKW